MRLVDLTGQVFGRLTVLYRDTNTNDSETRWMCRCSCPEQTLVSVRATNLRSGKVRSCGCIKINDLTGSKFGYLTVTGIDHRDYSEGSRHGVYWKCHCDCCGQDCVKFGPDLLSGRIKSCGCLRGRRKVERKERIERNRKAAKIEAEKKRRSREAMIAENMSCGNIREIIEDNSADPAYGLSNTRLYRAYWTLIHSLRVTARSRGCSMGELVVPEWYIDGLSQVELKKSGNVGLRNFAIWSDEHGYREPPKGITDSEKPMIVRLDQTKPLGPNNAQWMTKRELAERRNTLKTERATRVRDSRLAKHQKELDKRVKRIYKDAKDAGVDITDKDAIEAFYAEERLKGIYKGILSRLHNKHRYNYWRYGGRNLIIDPEWYTPKKSGYKVSGYYAFREAAYKMGYHSQPIETPYEDLLSIDRIDNDIGYMRDNVQWVPIKEQSGNRRSNNLINDGEETLAWSSMVRKYDRTGKLDSRFIASRYYNGWTSGAIIMALKYPEMEIRKTPEGYVNGIGHLILIPKVGYIKQNWKRKSDR